MLDISILVVSDDLQIRDMIIRDLKSFGYTCKVTVHIGVQIVGLICSDSKDPISHHSSRPLVVLSPHPSGGVAGSKFSIIPWAPQMPGPAKRPMTSMGCRISETL